MEKKKLNLLFFPPGIHLTSLPVEDAPSSARPQPWRNGLKTWGIGSAGQHRLQTAQPGKQKLGFGGFGVFFFALDRGFLAEGADPSPSAGACQAALISPSSGEDNACLGRVPSVTSARACQREVFFFALYCYQMLLVSSPGAGAPAQTRGARWGEIPSKTPSCPKIPLRQHPSLRPHRSRGA